MNRKKVASVAASLVKLARHPPPDCVVGDLAFAYTLRESNWRSEAPMTGPHGDQFVMIKIEGMHCHRCEQSIKKAIAANDGVHEVEVDFLSGQASILYDPNQVKIRQLVDSVAEAGYRATGFTQGRADPAAH